MEAFQLGSKAARLKETPVRLTNMETSRFFMTVMGQNPEKINVNYIMHDLLVIVLSHFLTILLKGV